MTALSASYWDRILILFTGFATHHKAFKKGKSPVSLSLQSLFFCGGENLVFVCFVLLCFFGGESRALLCRPVPRLAWSPQTQSSLLPPGSWDWGALLTTVSRLFLFFSQFWGLNQGLAHARSTRPLGSFSMACCSFWPTVLVPLRRAPQDHYHPDSYLIVILMSFLHLFLRNLL